MTCSGVLGGYVMSYRKCFLLWLFTFIIFCICIDIYVFQKAANYTYKELCTITDSDWCRIFVAIFIACWSLPLAVTTYRRAKEASKKIKMLIGIIIIWLSLGLLGCLVHLAL